MRVMRVEDFLEDFGRAVKPTMNMSIYQADYQCGCGKTHWFSGHEYIICEGWRKVMVRCPEGGFFVNSLRIKTAMILKFKGFESLACAEIQSEDDAATIQAVASYVRRR